MLLNINLNAAHVVIVLDIFLSFGRLFCFSPSPVAFNLNVVLKAKSPWNENFSTITHCFCQRCGQLSVRFLILILLFFLPSGGSNNLCRVRPFFSVPHPGCAESFRLAFAFQYSPISDVYASGCDQHDSAGELSSFERYSFLLALLMSTYHEYIYCLLLILFVHHVHVDSMIFQWNEREIERTFLHVPGTVI